MPYKVAIRKNDTGEIRFANIDMDWYREGKDDGGDFFWWTEGNMGCDCNRKIQFDLAGNSHAETPGQDHPCSEGKYSALYAELPDGKKIELDRGGLDSNEKLN